MKKRFLSFGMMLVLVLMLGLSAGAINDAAMPGVRNVVLTTTYSTFAVDADGILWAWGSNLLGLLGDGTDINCLSPVKILDNVAALGGGDMGGMAVIKTDGSLWTWGDNYSGALGDGTTIKRNTPAKVMDNVASVSVGVGHMAAIKTDGSLWTWGDNYAGELGDGFTPVGKSQGDVHPNRPIPAKVMDDVVAVSAGSQHTAAIKSDGSLWIWGSNREGQLGTGGLGNKEFFDGTYIQTIPLKILDNVAAVSASTDHTVAVKTDGTLWTWGRNFSGNLGTGTTENALTPVQVLDNVISVTTGFSSTAAIRTDNSLWVMGMAAGIYNAAKDAGRAVEYNDKSAVICTVPVKMQSDVAAVSFGGYDDLGFAVKTDGSLWAWGPNNKFGQLGDGTTESRMSPIKVMDHILTPSNLIPVAPLPTVPTSPCVATLDGKTVTLNAFLFQENGGGANYVMLRDVAYLLNGTQAQFEVGWTAKDGITLTTGQAYTPVGQELEGKGDGAKIYTPNTSTIAVDGKAVELTAYTIEGNNYFKLRDLGEALGFAVGWDGATGTVTITTK